MTQEALKLALEALENGDVPTPENVGKNLDAITAIKQALAQTQEPDDIASILACRDMLDAQPVPPRTWVGSGDLEDSNAYLTPPQRTWVGLTDEERIEIDHLALSRVQAVQMTEAKLKEKNT
jgi:hypothetical protein